MEINIALFKFVVSSTCVY